MCPTAVQTVAIAITYGHSANAADHLKRLQTLCVFPDVFHMYFCCGTR